MPSRSQHGRRRAAPTSAPISRRLTAVPLSSLLNRGPRFGAAAAATGLIAVSVLSAAQAAPEQSGTAREVVPAASPASVVQPMISAEAAASLSFDRPAVSSQAAPVVVAAPPAKVEAAPAGAVQAPPVAAPAPPVETAPGLRAPMASVNVSSPFGLRVNPLTGATGEWHTGMDLTGACSTPVFAAGAGTVVEAGWSQYGGGNRIVVDHGNGLKTTYNHLASIGVSVGQVLAKGVQIAGVGTTGNSTGCHLHFEVMVNDKTVDPASFI